MCAAASPAQLTATHLNVTQLCFMMDSRFGPTCGKLTQLADMLQVQNINMLLHLSVHSSVCYTQLSVHSSVCYTQLLEHSSVRYTHSTLRISSSSSACYSPIYKANNL